MKNKPFYLSDDHVRSFGGKLTDFESRDEAMKEKKHLKAYLAGRKTYRHGYESVPFHVAIGLKVETDATDELTTEMVRRPKVYNVEEVWTPKTKK